MKIPMYTIQEKSIDHRLMIHNRFKWLNRWRRIWRNNDRKA